ncbi:MAG TPA: thioredoxin [Fibrobacter sp.]|nr:thioredoxin [Fibrobacter sp.]
MSVIELTKENFEAEVTKSSKPVLIDFWASWCGPCRTIGPIVDEVAKEATDAKVCKVNVDDQPELAQQFQISNIPTLVVMKDGKVVNKAVGGRSKADLLQMLKV